MTYADHLEASMQEAGSMHTTTQDRIDYLGPHDGQMVIVPSKRF